MVEKTQLLVVSKYFIAEIFHNIVTHLIDDIVLTTKKEN